MNAAEPVAEVSEAAHPQRRARLMLATDLGETSGGLALAAAVGVAVAVEEERGSVSGVLLAELGAAGGRGPTMLASAQARELEDRLREGGFGPVAARGRLCWLGLPATEEALGGLPRGQRRLRSCTCRRCCGRWRSSRMVCVREQDCFAPTCRPTGHSRRWR
jgi:hypothetical protein